MRVKIALTVAVITMTVLISTGIAQQVGGFVEAESLVERGKLTPQLNVYVHGPLKSKLGWSAWSLTSRPYSEAYAGLTYAPAKWVELSGSLGLETANNPLRVAGSIWMGKGCWTILSIHEYGGSGFWYKSLGTYQTTKTTAMGLYGQRFVGVGPYAEKKFGKATLWGTYAIGDSRVLLGARFNF